MRHIPRIHGIFPYYKLKCDSLRDFKHQFSKPESAGSNTQQWRPSKADSTLVPVLWLGSPHQSKQLCDLLSCL